jgi:predicted helicase
MSSKHPSAAQLIRRGFYDNLRSFAELELRIGTLGQENTKIVGDALEVFVEGYLATHQKLQVDTVWLVGHLPLDVRQTLNLPNDAKGIDGVFRTRTGTLVPYQVKFRSKRAYLTFTEVAPFLGLTERANDRIVFTNSNEVAEDAKNRDAMRTVRGMDFDELTADDLLAISGWLRKQPISIPQPTPCPHQVTALSQIAETLTRSDRAHVVMACGTGKTRRRSLFLFRHLHCFNKLLLSGVGTTGGARISPTSASVLTQPSCQRTNTIPFSWRRWI